MRSLFKFILRFYHVFLFLILQLICIVLIATSNPYQGAVLFNAANTVTGSMHSMSFSVKEYFHLQRINDSLMAENARLRQQMPVSFYNEDFEEREVVDSLLQQKFTYIPANVINNSIERRNNYLTIDKGSRHGLEGSMGLITTAGIAGVINQTGNNFSTAVSVLHQSFRISANIADINEIGSLVWDGRDPRVAILRDIPLQAKVEVGQEVVTSPFSLLFPENHPIGKIVRIEEERSRHFWTIYVELNVDLRNITKVYVVNNLMKKEQQTLENNLSD